RTWWRVGPALAEHGWRVIAVDQRGHGRSPPIDGVATAESMAAALAATLETMDMLPVELAANPPWLEEDARQDVEGRALCDLEGILVSLRNDTGHRVLDLVPTIGIPTLDLLADEARSVPGPMRAELIASAPATATVVELDAGHTVHRDRFVEYVASILGWLQPPPAA
ncbi:MAG: alpha/beta hydrolase, partial [Chloroflexota bacterium]|nr:alpha/beta hydrolase [Chloroflexota bacterium]